MKHTTSSWQAGMLAMAALAAGSTTAWSQTAPHTLDAKRLELAREGIRLYGDKISAPMQQQILEQRVVPGMTPYEAYLAAGAFSFAIQPDPAVWPPSADPWRVIQAQTLHPDHSVIRLTFRNATQFPDDGMTIFKVTFENGRATLIEQRPGAAQPSTE